MKPSVHSLQVKIIWDISTMPWDLQPLIPQESLSGGDGCLQAPAGGGYPLLEILGKNPWRHRHRWKIIGLLFWRGIFATCKTLVQYREHPRTMEGVLVLNVILGTHARTNGKKMRSKGPYVDMPQDIVPRIKLISRLMYHGINRQDREDWALNVAPSIWGSGLRWSQSCSLKQEYHGKMHRSIRKLYDIVQVVLTMIILAASITILATMFLYI